MVNYVVCELHLNIFFKKYNWPYLQNKEENVCKSINATKDLLKFDIQLWLKLLSKLRLQGNLLHLIKANYYKP